MASEVALREVCALLFNEPRRVAQFLCHRRRKTPWTNPAHRHDDLIQLDLCEGFEGLVLQADRRIACSGSMAFVHYPGVRHRYALTPARRTARLFSLKLRLPPDVDLVCTRAFPEMARHFVTCRELIATLLRLERETASSHGGALRGTALVAEVLSLWPTARGKESPPLRDADAAGHARDLAERAAAFIEDSIERPLRVDEVARHVGVSKRQLGRRLRATLGIGIHELIEQRRLTVARERLADAHSTATEVAETLGFSSIHAFSRWFSRLTGQAPSRYRETFGNL